MVLKVSSFAHTGLIINLILVESFRMQCEELLKDLSMHSLFYQNNIQKKKKIMNEL